MDILIIVFCFVTCALIIGGLIVILPISAKCQNCSCNFNTIGGTLNLTDMSGLGNISLPGR
jgi:hypothetical protein